MDIAVTGPVQDTDRERVIAFLRDEGYSQPIQAADEIFAAWADSEVVGAARLAVEEGVTVLRGMRVRANLRHRGIGRQLLRRLDEVLGTTTCYCIPYGWLTEFYGGIGFKLVNTNQVPPFLAERHARYTQVGLDVVLMVRRQVGFRQLSRFGTDLTRRPVDPCVMTRRR